MSSMAEFASAVTRELNRERQNGELISEGAVLAAVESVVRDGDVAWMYERDDPAIRRRP